MFGKLALSLNAYRLKPYISFTTKSTYPMQPTTYPVQPCRDRAGQALCNWNFMCTSRIEPKVNFDCQIKSLQRNKLQLKPFNLNFKMLNILNIFFCKN